MIDELEDDVIYDICPWCHRSEDRHDSQCIASDTDFLDLDD